MKIKTGSLLLVVLCVVLGAELYYLKRLPGSFVRVYYAHDVNDFNQPPTEAMTGTFGGTRFDYRIPHRIPQKTFAEITEAVKDTSLEGMDSILLVARWVRRTVQFAGGSGYTPPGRPEDYLGDVTKGVVRGLCDFYARLFVITCQSLGIPARIIELEGHVVPEAFLKERARWVMIDPTFGYYMKRGNDPLSVVELIQCYRHGISLTPAVFAEGKGDDCLYSAADEINLREVYLNGFTVISDHQVDYTTIHYTMLKTFTVPLVKVQYMDSNSPKIGARERALRYSVVITAILVGMVGIATVVPRRRHFPVS